MMPILHDNGFEQVGETRAKLPTNMAKDLFTYSLVGALGCYVDRETMASCIQSALATLKVWEKTSEKTA